MLDSPNSFYALCIPYDLSFMKDRKAVGHPQDDPNVMGNEKIGSSQFVAKSRQKVKDSGLDDHIQAAHRLIQDNHFGFQSNRPRNAHPLQLAAAELMGQLFRVRRLEPDHFQ
jgi:hypothetical protein